MNNKKIITNTLLAAFGIGLSAVVNVIGAAPATSTATAGAKHLHTAASTSHKPFGTGQNNMILDDDSVAGGKIFMLEVTDNAKNPWDAGLFSYVVGEIKPGDRIEASLWLKVIDPINEGKVAVAFQLAEPPRTEFIRKNFSITNKWEQYKVEFKASQAQTPYSVSLRVHVGLAKQTIAFGPMTFVSLGK